MVSYANGKFAAYICSRCGFRCKYTERKQELSGLFVCPTCYDGNKQLLNHPLNQPLTPFGADSVLYKPNPDVIPTQPTPFVISEDNIWDGGSFEDVTTSTTTIDGGTL